MYSTVHKLRNDFLAQGVDFLEQMRGIVQRMGGSTSATSAFAASHDPLHDRQLLLNIIRDLEAKLIAADKQDGDASKHIDVEFQKMRDRLDAEVQNRLRLERRYIPPARSWGFSMRFDIDIAPHECEKCAGVCLSWSQFNC